DYNRYILSVLIQHLKLSSYLPNCIIHLYANVHNNYLNRSVSLTRNVLSAQSPSSQAQTSISIPQSFSIFFYTQPLAEGQISGSTWTVTIYAQAVPGQTDTGSLTAELSIYSLDGTIQNALIGSSSGNAVTATTTKIDIPIQVVTTTAKNGDRLTLRLYAESVAGSTPSLKLFYDGQV